VRFLRALQSMYAHTEDLPDFSALVKFYSPPEIHPKQIKPSNLSPNLTSRPSSNYPFQELFVPDNDMTPTSMNLKTTESLPTVDQTITPTSHPPTWNNDTNVSAISNEIFDQLQKRQQSTMEVSNLDNDAPSYDKPDRTIIYSSPFPTISQRIRFNLRYPNRKAVQIVPYHSQECRLLSNHPPLPVFKTTYSSLSNIKQIQTVDDLKVQQFFRPYYQKQLYSLSGFFHISSNFSNSAQSF